MANLLRSGTEWLGSVFGTHVSETLEYRRANGPVATLRLTPGATDAENVQDASITLMERNHDYLTTVADFEAAFGVGERPRLGDEILHGERVMRVSPIGSSPCWRYCDTHANRLRIHTQHYSGRE